MQPLPAWSANLRKRLVKAPKLHLIDAGLTAHLRGQADAEALALSPKLGPLLETFVVQEPRRHLHWADTAATASHFRMAVGQEVDLVLETPDQRVVGVAIKASASLNQGDPNGLPELRRAASLGAGSRPRRPDLRKRRRQLKSRPDIMCKALSKTR